mgnify:FL=1
MQCKWSKRFGRIGANFGISFLTPLIGINFTNTVIANQDPLMNTIFQSLGASAIYTALSVCTEIRAWGSKDVII